MPEPKTPLITRLIHDDRGMTMAVVALLGMLLAALSATVLVRTGALTDDVSSDRQWENALYVADSGMETATLELADDPDWNTGDLNASLQTRDQVIAAALAKPASDVIKTPEGDVVLIKPTDADVLYSVGFAPSRDAATRVRIVAAPVQNNFWVPNAALLVGGNLKIEAKKKDKDVEIFGDLDLIHANGSIEFKNDDKTIHNIDAGCVTSYADQYSNEEPTSNVTCPMSGSVPELDVPDIDPMAVHYLSQYDICPDGITRHGPNSPDASAVKATPGQPCTGGPVLIDLKLKNDNKPGDKVEWDKNSVEAVYFLYGRSMRIKKEDNEPNRFLTVIATKPNNDLTCNDVGVDKDEYGDIELDVGKKTELYPHPEGNKYTIVTSGDIKMKLKGKSTGKSGDKQIGMAHGIFLAREQIKLESNDVDLAEPDEPKGAIHGTIVAQDACDTKDSKVDKGYSELKKGDIVFDPAYSLYTDFVIEGTTDNLTSGFRSEF